MAERVGRVGRGLGDAEMPREADSDLDAGSGRARGRGLTGLFALGFSGLVLYLAWWLLWERSHPAASVAWRVQDGDATVRLEALRELEVLGPHDPEVAVPALIEGLADADPVNRAAAAQALAAVTLGIGTTTPDTNEVRDALVALMDHLTDPDGGVRARSARSLWTVVLGWHGSPRVIDIDTLEAETVRLADDPSAEVRVAAVQGLAALAAEASQAPPPRLIVALDDESEDVRMAAAHGLAQFHRALVRMLPDLVTAMEKARSECRPAYFSVLRRFRPWEYPKEITGEVVPALVPMLRGRDRQVRCQVIATLGEFGHDARAALPLLLAALDEPAEPAMPGPGHEEFSKVRDPAVAAAAALRRVAGNDSQVQPSKPRPRVPDVTAALMRLGRAPDAGRRLAAVRALTSFEPDDAVVGAFIAASRDRDESVRIAGLQALQGGSGPLRAQAVATVRDALEDRSPRVRSAAAFALFEFGSGSEPVVPALIRHAEHDPDPLVRDMSARAVGSLRPPAISAAVVPLCIAAVGRPGATLALRGNLLRVLIAFGPDARPAVPVIARVLRSAVEDARREIPVRDMHVPAIVASRSPEEAHSTLRTNAARALGDLAPGTPSANEALAVLVAALDDPAEDVVHQVLDALQRFGPAAREAAPGILRAMHRAREQKDLARAGRMAEALGRIHPTAPGAGEAVAFLNEALQSSDLLPRLFAERVLGIFGPAAAPAVPRLVALTRRPALRRTQEMTTIATALGAVAPGTPEEDDALAALLELVRLEPDLPFLDAVLPALSRFGPKASAVLPRLRELTRSDHPRVSEAAQKVLADLEGAGPTDAGASSSGGGPRASRALPRAELCRPLGADRVGGPRQVSKGF